MTKIKTPITIKHRTKIGQAEQVSFITTGTYYLKDQHTYITFKEPNEIGEIQTIIKIGRAECVIIRSGSVQMRHVFKRNTTTESVYTSVAGSFTMQTNTTRIEYKRGQLSLSYLLHMNHQSMGRYKVTVSFKEEQS